MAGEFSVIRWWSGCELNGEVHSIIHWALCKVLHFISSSCHIVGHKSLMACNTLHQSREVTTESGAEHSPAFGKAANLVCKKRSEQSAILSGVSQLQRKKRAWLQARE